MEKQYRNRSPQGVCGYLRKGDRCTVLWLQCKNGSWADVPPHHPALVKQVRWKHSSFRHERGFQYPQVSRASPGPRVICQGVACNSGLNMDFMTYLGEAADMHTGRAKGGEKQNGCIIEISPFQVAACSQMLPLPELLLMWLRDCSLS